MFRVVLDQRAIDARFEDLSDRYAEAYLGRSNYKRLQRRLDAGPSQNTDQVSRASLDTAGANSPHAKRTKRGPLRLLAHLKRFL